MKLDVVQKSDGNISIISTWENDPRAAIKAYHQRCALMANDDSYNECWVAILNDSLDVYENFRERFKIPKPITYEVMFNSYGGSPVESQAVIEGNSAIEPETPIKDGYVFVRWELDGYEYDFSLPVTKNITLVAKWEQL